MSRLPSIYFLDLEHHQHGFERMQRYPTPDICMYQDDDQVCMVTYNHIHHLTMMVGQEEVTGINEQDLSKLLYIE